MNKIFKLATGHYLLVDGDALTDVLPTDMNMYSETASGQAKFLRRLADEIDEADRRLTERKK